VANARDQMKVIQGELQRVKEEIATLRVKEAVLEDLLRKLSGEPELKRTKTRSPNVKPLVLDIMRDAGVSGATSAEVDQLVREKVPTVAKDTVGSVLSRLKSDGALVHDGERYYEKQFAPEPKGPFSPGLRAVN
jgi:predicted nuclease with TOPRIM domain